MKERDCANCKHHTEDGCSSWDCEFEAIDLISRAEAIAMLDDMKKEGIIDEYDVHWVGKWLNKLPSANAVPYCSTREVSWSEPRTWHEKNSHTYICGDCGFEQAIYGNINEYNCCPRCGIYKEYVDFGGIFQQKRTPYRGDGDVE